MIKNKPDINLESVYSQSQAARALDVDRHTIARYVKSGALESSRRGNRTVIKGSSLLDIWQGKSDAQP